jgi:hypothetical protein
MLLLVLQKQMLRSKLTRFVHRMLYSLEILLYLILKKMIKFIFIRLILEEFDNFNILILNQFI